MGSTTLNIVAIEGNTSFVARNGMTVTLNEVILTDLGNGYSNYQVTYTEMNLTSIAIDQATLRLYFENASPAPHYGFFNRVLPGRDFATTNTYTFTVESSARPTILEYDGDNFFADTPVAGALQWEFSGNSLIWTDPSADITAPSVTTFSPADEAAEVAIDENIVVTFSEAIQRGVGNIVLKTTAGSTVATYDAATSTNLLISGSTLTINPTADLAYNTTYKVEFNAGTIKDLAGNSYVGTTSYNFTTESSPNVLGTPDNDTLIGGRGVLIDGLAGIDTVIYSSNFSSITYNANGTWSVGTDILTNIERLKFADLSVALDLDSHAGSVVKILGAVFGSASIHNKEYVGIGLFLMGDGMSYEDLSALAVSVAGKTTHADVVDLLWSNVVGTPITSADKANFIGLLDGGMSIGTLTALAADTSFNTENIGLVGLAQTGIEFVPFAG